MRRALALLLILGAAAPAAAQGAAATGSGDGSYLRQSDHRVQAIVYRLGAAGRALCPDPLPLTGLAFHHLAEYAPADRARAVADYGIDRGPGILSVIAGSPAARAGLRAGDVVVAVNGSPVAAPSTVAAAADWRALVAAFETGIEEQLRRGPARLGLLRGGRPLAVTLAGEPGCPARGRLARSNQANAFADGRYAIMTTRFLGFLRSDEELAVAMAHELAHNILRHPQQLEAEGVPHGMMRHLGRNARLVRATEIEADRLSVRLLAAAGYDLGAIMPFWERVHRRGDSILYLISAHPGLAARRRVIEAEIAAVRAAAAAASPH